MVNNKKQIAQAGLGVSVLLVAGIIMVLNFFADAFSGRFDLTAQKDFSLSPVSIETARSLDDIVHIKVYFSGKVANMQPAVKQQVSDFLSDYARQSNGNFRFIFIDPDKDEASRAEADSAGVPMVRMQGYEKDKAQIIDGYMGLTMEFAGHKEIIPVIKNSASDLEYQITAALKKVKSGNKRRVGYLVSNGATPLASLEKSRQAFDELYDFVEVDLSEWEKQQQAKKNEKKDDKKDPRRDENEKPDVLDSIDLLIVVGTKEVFSKSEMDRVEKFVKGGKSLLVLADNIIVGNGLTASLNKSNVSDLVARFGVKLNKDLVMDYERNSTVPFSNGYISYMTPYPFWPSVIRDGFNKDVGSVSALESVSLSWASSIDFDKAKLKDGTQLVLMSSSDKSGLQTDTFDVTPAQPAPSGGQSRRNLAVLTQMAATDKEKPGRVIVIGDADFATDGAIGQRPDNFNLFQNLAESLVLDGDLIYIRSKLISSRPIKEDLEESEKNTIRYTNIFLVAFLTAGYGMFRHFSRRQSRFVSEIR